MKRAPFNLSHYKLLTANLGQLVPIGVTQVKPGDTFQHSTSGLIRCSPMVAPPMHPVHVSFHHWFVPFRIIWEDFEKFITGGEDGMDESVFPTITTPASTGFALGSLADHLGIPPGVPDKEVSALPFRAYALIYNEWYRDQDLISKLGLSKASGPDTTTNTTLQNSCWEKDYFTVARPWEQKGPEVTIPLGTTAPVITNEENIIVGVGGQEDQRNIRALQTNNNVGVDGAALPANYNLQFGDETGLVTDLSEASAATINALREAFAIQRFQERMARHGSRYVEYLRSQGVISSDARLQRPEYLGGGKETIQFSEVIQTAPGSSEEEFDVVGDMKGHGIAGVKSNRYTRFFEEHGYIISLMTVRPKTMYTQGLRRDYSYKTKFDFFQPELQHIGQQAIKKKEIYFNAADGDEDFGFGDRYDELRRMESSVSGDFRDSLDDFHFARIFETEPTLNGSFVTCVPQERPFAVPSEDVLWVMVNHRMKARRILSKTAKSYIY